MICLMTQRMSISPTEQAVRRLAYERPDWLPVLEAAAAVAARVEEHGGEFAGAWVAKELSERGSSRWIPNLRILVGFGLLEKSGPSTRGGRKAYYRMPHRAEVEHALAGWHAGQGHEKRPLRFIASGSSGGKPGDTARQAGEIAYGHRSSR